MRVCMGGTFDPLHRGHRMLLDRAFAIGSHVFIGVTSDALAHGARKRHVAPYKQREAALRKFIKDRGWLDRATISQIMTPYGRSTDAAYEVIVVTPETRGTAGKINRARADLGLAPLRVEEVPMALAADGERISATRIRKGEVDAEGRLLQARVAVGSANPAKVKAVKDAARDLFQRAQVKGYRVPSTVADQPLDAEAVKGAQQRARAALQHWPQAQLGVGIEAGLAWDAGAQQHFDVQWCAIVDRAGRITMGHGPGFTYPADVVERIKGGSTVGDVMSEVAGVKDLGAKQGAIGFLSRGAMDRAELTRGAVLMAMLPRLRPELYGL
ncbi:MAG TPA: inosine/xanthosine triphosphatase [Candidatus Thermoplasmatota archaeon]|nr:inosine/xanthosine triphosphatase [Candidatus Thermoplasmatota archaeon]